MENGDRKYAKTKQTLLLPFLIFSLGGTEVRSGGMWSVGRSRCVTERRAEASSDASDKKIKKNKNSTNLKQTKKDGVKMQAAQDDEECGLTATRCRTSVR